jgi:hypothetical protein
LGKVFKGQNHSDAWGRAKNSQKNEAAIFRVFVVGFRVPWGERAKRKCYLIA